MRLLIVGEFSSFAKELKKGFITLNIGCTIISWGDGMKRIKQNKDDYTFEFIVIIYLRDY